MSKINLQKIVNVKGKPGLYHLNSYNPRGYNLQPLEGGPVIFVSNEKNKVLALGNVDLKQKEGSINLMNVFNLLNEYRQGTPENAREFFLKFIPDLDESVAESHLQKVLTWHEMINREASEIVNEVDDGLTIT